MDNVIMALGWLIWLGNQNIKWKNTGWGPVGLGRKECTIRGIKISDPTSGWKNRCVLCIFLTPGQLDTQDLLMPYHSSTLHNSSFFSVSPPPPAPQGNQQAGEQSSHLLWLFMVCRIMSLGGLRLASIDSAVNNRCDFCFKAPGTPLTYKALGQIPLPLQIPKAALGKSLPRSSRSPNLQHGF